MMNTTKYQRALVWFIASLCFSCANDTITKLLGQQAIDTTHITFGRLFFALITLLPYTCKYPKLWYTNHFKLHIARGSIYVIAISLWNHALSQQTTHITTATIISFTIPLFVLLISTLYLQEKPTLTLLLYTIVTLVGLTFIIPPTQAFNHQAIPLLIAVILFASLDVINKYSIHKESIYTIILYSNITALFCILPFINFSYTLSTKQVLSFIPLGLGNNAIIFSLLKAYQNTTLISLAPVRYLELPISIGASILLFDQKPQKELLFASLSIIPATLGIIYHQSIHQKNNE